MVIQSFWRNSAKSIGSIRCLLANHPPASLRGELYRHCLFPRRRLGFLDKAAMLHREWPRAGARGQGGITSDNIPLSELTRPLRDLAHRRAREQPAASL